MRITDKDLQILCDRINAIAGHPKDAYSNGQVNGNVYLLDYAYGQPALHRMMPTGTGERRIIPRCSRPELYERMHAFIRGMQANRSNNDV